MSGTTVSTGSALLTTNETAGLLRVSESTVRRLARRGELPGVRIGRQWRIKREGLGLVPRQQEGSDDA